MIYKVTTPESEADENYSKFEYLLGWFDFNGNWQQYLFTDWENKRDYDNEILNNEVSDSSSVIGSILSKEEDKVLLTVEDATLQDVQVFLSIFRNEKIVRIFKDGSTQTVAPDSNSISYNQRGIRFQFNFEIIQVPSYEIRG